ncbi:MAG: hypothetical protein ABR591_05730 [Candidatus Velthaea sp.]
MAALYCATLGETPRLELAHLYEATGDAHRAGGDLVDAYTYDSGSTSIIMADIAGHGLEAAMHAAMVKYSMRAFACRVRSRAFHQTAMKPEIRSSR